MLERGSLRREWFVLGLAVPLSFGCGESKREVADSPVDAAGAAGAAGTNAGVAGGGSGGGGGIGGTGGLGGAGSAGSSGASVAGAGVAGQSGFATVRNCQVARSCSTLTTVIGEVQSEPTVEQLRCVLETLRDGTPGVLEEAYQMAAANGSSSGSRYLVHDDRTYDAIHWFSSSGPGGSSSSQTGPVRCELFTPEHYSGCIDALDAATIPGDLDAGQPSTTTYLFSDCGLGTNCVESTGRCP